MFDIKGNKVIITADDLAIPPFEKFFNSAKNKDDALKKIKYVVWRYKWNTPYEAYPEDCRDRIVAMDVFGKEYHPDDDVKELIKRFNEFQETPSTRLLSASKSACEKLISCFTELSKEDMDVDTALKVTRILKDVGSVVKSLDSAERQAKAEQQELGRVKGGGSIGMYELPNK